MKLGEILNLNQLLKTIIDDNKLKIDSLLKFRLLGIMKDIESSVGNFESIRNEKIREYGKEINDENGNTTIQIQQDDKEAVKKFTNDMDKLINSNVDIQIHKLNVNDVFDKGLPADYLVGLYPIIEE